MGQENLKKETFENAQLKNFWNVKKGKLFKVLMNSI